MSKEPRRLAIAIAVFVGGIVALFVMGRRSASEDSEKEKRASEDGSSSNTRLPGTVDVPADASDASRAGPGLDRARADRIREILRAAAAAPDVPTNERTRKYAEMPRETDGGELRSYIRSVVRDDYIPLAKQCYESSLVKNPKLRGRVAMNFEIVGDTNVGGVVESASFDDETTTIIDQEFRTCLRESMMSVAFDAPPGGKVTVTYPIEFSPDDPDDSDPGH